MIEADGSIEQLTSGASSDSQQYSMVDWAPGACLIMARQTWETVGGFDTWMNFLFEDIDWCLRVRESGGRVLVHRELHLIHEPNQSLGGPWSGDRVRFWARNGTFFRLTSLELQPSAIVAWLRSEVLLAARDLANGRASWSVARLIGLAEGLSESAHRRVGGSRRIPYRH